MLNRLTSVKSSPAKSTLADVADEPSMFLVNQLCFAIYSTSLAMTKLYRPLLSAVGVTYPQYVVLLALWEQDNVTVTALGKKVSLDSGTLTPLLKRLQTQGLIERQRSEIDEREVHIKLTREGADMKKKADAIHYQIACATECSSVQRKSLTRALQKLRASLLAH